MASCRVVVEVVTCIYKPVVVEICICKWVLVGGMASCRVVEEEIYICKLVAVETYTCKWVLVGGTAFCTVVVVEVIYTCKQEEVEICGDEVGDTVSCMEVVEEETCICTPAEVVVVIYSGKVGGKAFCKEEEVVETCKRVVEEVGKNRGTD